MWDLTAPGQPAHILPTDSTNDLGNLSALAFLGGGSTLLTRTSEAGYLISPLADLRAGKMPVSTPLSGHAGKILDVSASADGRWLISGGADGTPRLKASTVLRGHEGEVSSVTIGRDGQWAATLDAKGVVRMQYDGRRFLQWSLDAQQLAQEACEVVGRNLSQLEWDMYFPADDYHATCNLFSKELDDGSTARR